MKMHTSGPGPSFGLPQTVPGTQTSLVPPGKSQASPGSDSLSHAVVTTQTQKSALMTDRLVMR
jgi:hypothetical protein